jgi:hypothetical protein
MKLNFFIVFKKDTRVLRRMFGPKGDEVTGELRKLHNEELNPWRTELNLICN